MVVWHPDLFKGGPTLGDLMDLTWKDWLWVLGVEVGFWGLVALGVIILL